MTKTVYECVQSLQVVNYFILISQLYGCLQCFDAVVWVAGRASGL